MRLDYHSTRNNFHLSLSLVDEGLIITAEDKLSSNVYFKLITDDTIKASLDLQLLDVNTIFKLLRDLLKNESDKGSISLSKYGELTCSYKVMLDTISKQMSFTIKLEKQSLKAFVQEDKPDFELLILDKPGLSEKALLETRRKVLVSRQETSYITKLKEKAIMFLNNLKINKEWTVCLLSFIFVMALFLLSTHQTLITTSKNNWRFDPLSQNAYAYTFSNGRRTVAGKIGGASVPICTETSIPKGEKSHFSFLIENEGGYATGAMIGISPYDKDTKSPILFDFGTTFCYRSSGVMTKTGMRETNLPAYGKGDVVSFEVDMQTGEVMISINKKHIYTEHIPQTHIAKYEFIPYFISYGPGSASATLI